MYAFHIGHRGPFLSARRDERSGSLYNLRTSFCALMIATPAVAQSRFGGVSGTVKDSLGNHLPNVEVTALRAAKSVRTDTAGSFVIAGLAPGPTDISVRRLSYAPLILSIEIPPSDTTDVEITLGVTAQQLTGVLVQADANHVRELADFENRRKQGIGHFITRAQIEDRRPLLLSDMMRMVPGTTLVPTGAGQVALRFDRAAHPNCPPQFYIDGMPVFNFSIDEMPPGDVEGVEVYAGSAALPAQFNRMRSTTMCGTVIIWTRIPGTDKTDKKKP